MVMSEKDKENLEYAKDKMLLIMREYRADVAAEAGKAYAELLKVQLEANQIDGVGN